MSGRSICFSLNPILKLKRSFIMPEDPSLLSRRQTMDFSKVLLDPILMKFEILNPFSLPKTTTKNICANSNLNWLDPNRKSLEMLGIIML